jgi:hypothetical protein
MLTFQSLGVEKYKKFSGGEYHQTPLLVTNNHLSFPHTRPFL